MRYCAGAKPSSADFSYQFAACRHVGRHAAAFGDSASRPRTAPWRRRRRPLRAARPGRHRPGCRILATGGAASAGAAAPCRGRAVSAGRGRRGSAAELRVGASPVAAAGRRVDVHLPCRARAARAGVGAAIAGASKLRLSRGLRMSSGSGVSHGRLRRGVGLPASVAAGSPAPSTSRRSVRSARPLVEAAPMACGYRRIGAARRCHARRWSPGRPCRAAGRQARA